MRIHYFLFLLVFPTLLFSQEKKSKELDYNSKYNSSDSIKKSKAPVATIDMYQLITLDRDTTYIDTSLTIQKEYSHNYLRKDIFGLMPFSNIGQTYNTLQYGLKGFSPLPEFGFTAKQFAYIEADEIRYGNVATPVTELYFKSVIQKGQSLDAFFTMNTSKRLNFSIAYKGLRSEGRYINQLASTGNLRFTTSYNTKSGRYIANAHFTSQDISNEENGGITTVEDFESGNPDYTNRARLQVYFTDAISLLKGRRLFLDQAFRINPSKGSNNLFVTEQFNYENKFFEYSQQTIQSTVGTELVDRFGESFVTSGINDKTKYNKMYNKLGFAYENTTLGKFQFFVDDFRTNYYYQKVLILDDDGVIPSSLSQVINNVGGEYDYRKNNWRGKFSYSKSITDQSLSNLDAKLQYDFNDDNQVSFQYQNMNKLPNNNYELFQSSYQEYNWSNNFKNEKINAITVNATTPWVNASMQYTVLNDHLYFKDVSTAEQAENFTQIIAPEQYGNAINYLSIKASKEFKFGKFALDNTFLYQKVDQSDAVLNVPEFVTRNTFYFSDHFFNKKLFLQTGIVFNYFTDYYGNNFNPLIGEFYVQDKVEIGNFPNFDFFINAQIQRTRIYLKAEHFNSSFGKSDFLSAPNYPYRDFAIRFGLVWNFFN